MNKKTISIISYITIIGWVIAFIMYGNNPEKSSLAKFHLKQSFGLALLGILNFIIEGVVVSFAPSASILFTIIGLGIFVLWIIGIVNAVNEEEKPVPLVGNLFVDKFDFIK
ncbi:DUF4870 domain-containing protein [Flavobacterium sp.]|uniref:DUF4870 domain-containing protein n=1 Tax=Flavobacterium sp. TaxID=239 RepID=UPI00374CD4E2